MTNNAETAAINKLAADKRLYADAVAARKTNPETEMV
jgi:hypothetical protein